MPPPPLAGPKIGSVNIFPVPPVILNPEMLLVESSLFSNVTTDEALSAPFIVVELALSPSMEIDLPSKFIASIYMPE